MRKSLFSLIAILGLQFLSAQTILGKWKTIDDESGKEKSVVEIFKKSDGKIYAKIVQLLIKPENDKCVKCKDDRKDKPLVGLEIIRGLSKDDEEFSGGTIMDPKKGKSYDCTIYLDPSNKELRIEISEYCINEKLFE